ncbi:MAG: hypothetical protein H0U69_11100 [Trueperaceae bacterium]|nr:hypothetical protein [Trueperaceae bacterium]
MRDAAGREARAPLRSTRGKLATARERRFDEVVHRYEERAAGDDRAETDYEHHDGAH